jgi:hypothetical protein
MFNPLDYPVIFLDTDYVAFSAWWQHTPFARLLVALTKPSLLVELGTHYGVSYFAFCQAVKALDLNTRCYAVDTWRGDEHASFYGEEVFEQVQRHNEQVYGTFSRLLRMTFDEALEHFAEGEIDLLHIDGYHTYEAVRHDYESWLPKMSRRGVVVFHDINVREGNFGVWQLWYELRDLFPNFEFLHEHGLGVLAIGAEAADLLAPLLALDDVRRSRMCQFFSQLGQRVHLHKMVIPAQAQQSATISARLQELERIAAEQAERLQQEHARHTQEIERLQGYIQQIESQLSTEREAHAQETENARGYIYRIEQELASHAQQLSAEREAHAHAIENAHSHIRQLEQELAACAQEHSSMANRTEQLGTQLTVCQAHVAALENARAAAQASLTASEEKCALLEARLAETQAAMDRLQRKLDAYRAIN